MENKNSSSLAAFLTILAVAGWRGKLECITEFENSEFSIVLNEETNEFDKVEATSELREITKSENSVFSINIKGQL